MAIESVGQTLWNADVSQEFLNDQQRKIGGGVKLRWDALINSSSIATVMVAEKCGREIASMFFDHMDRESTVKFVNWFASLPAACKAVPR